MVFNNFLLSFDDWQQLYNFIITGENWWKSNRLYKFNTRITRLHIGSTCFKINFHFTRVSAASTLKRDWASKRKLKQHMLTIICGFHFALYCLLTHISITLELFNDIKLFWMNLIDWGNYETFYERMRHSWNVPCGICLKVTKLGLQENVIHKLNMATSSASQGNLKLKLR